MTAPRRWRPTPLVGGALAVGGRQRRRLASGADGGRLVAAQRAARRQLDASARCRHAAHRHHHHHRRQPRSGGHAARARSLLDAHGTRATFFCISERVRAHPRIVADIVARGHAVENHSQRHQHNFSLLGPRALWREIGAAQASIGEIAGTQPLFFRAPVGLRNPFLEPVLCALGLQLASWTRHGFDTRTGDASVVAGHLLRGLAACDILLVHDGHAARDANGAPVVLDAPDMVLRRASEAGLACVTLREALIQGK